MAAKKSAKKTARKTPRLSSSRSAKWLLRLYVAGNTPNSIAAFANLKEICEVHLGGQYQIEVVDLLELLQVASDGDALLDLLDSIE